MFMATSSNNKIFVQINNDKIELTGEAKEAFLADREASLEAQRLLQAEYKAKQDARDSAIKKLGEIAGLTKEELDAIL
jgi:hypothetical protein